MPKFVHVRHRPPQQLPQSYDLILAASPLRSNVNLSRLVRLAGSAGVKQIIHCGTGKIDREIARDAADTVELVIRRSLPPVIEHLKMQGYCCVGLEQTTNSSLLFEYKFPQRTALIVGSEREGLSPEVLALLDDVVEIPVFGAPASYNVVTATTMAVYEYCKQSYCPQTLP